MINRLSLLAVLSLLLTGRSFATIPLTLDEIYNTGYTPTSAYPAPIINTVGSPEVPGSADMFFSLYSAYPQPPTFNAIVIPTADDGPGWVMPSGAQWIGPEENETGNSAISNPTPIGGLAGTYDYHAEFSTFLPDTTNSISMIGSVAADDSVMIEVNGILLDTITAEAYGALTPFDLQFTVGAGESMVPIDFIVDNTANGGSGSTNPTGLLISNLQFVNNSAPEPSTWALIIGGLASLAFIQRRRLLARV